jgi:membrane-bound lytic murein transglycosylase MltF
MLHIKIRGYYFMHRERKFAIQPTQPTYTGLESWNYRFACLLLLILTSSLWIVPVRAVDKVVASEVVQKIVKPWTGDYDEMIQRRLIRVLVPYSKTFYFIDGVEQRGTAYEAFKEFEKVINKDSKKKALQVRVVFIPVSRDDLISGLVKGQGDVAAGNLTITSERKKMVDFSDPITSGVSEIVVTGPTAPLLSSLEDLAGKEIHVRPSSSYYENLVRLNESFKKDGKPPIILTPADENFEDEDLLEMVNADLIPIIVVDNHKAEFWAQIFDHITLHPDLAVNRGGDIGWAFRKNSPKLAKVLNDFVKGHKIGTLFGNILLKKYLQSTKWVKNSTSEEEIKKFRMTIEFFQKYAGTYGFDWLMVAAQAYQESRLDQSLRSRVGAIGVMQILPSTAADPNVNIPDISGLENNIHAGVKYLRFIMDEYFKDSNLDNINKGLFAFASYNAGPAKIARLRKQAAKEGLDPNKWFYNVELIAAKEIGRETVQYVSNIYKYYVAYKLIAEKRALKEEKKTPKESSQ